MDGGQLVGGIIILAIIVFFVGGAVLGVTVISAREMAIWLLLRKYGKIGDAAIVDLCRNKRGRGSNYIRFNPTEDDANTVVQIITGRSYRKLKERTFVTVTYLPDAPYIARLWVKMPIRGRVAVTP
jgi:hypothetical protein